MRILLYGSTVLSAHVEATLPNLVGHIPSERAFLPGKMRSPIVTELIPHDIKLSVQFDRKLKNFNGAYNLHTGLLPAYGGCDILHHTLENNESEQGLTFHAMSESLDAGPIFSTVTYPVLPKDGIVDLYMRMLAIAPMFVLASLALLPLVPIGFVAAKEPNIYKRGDVRNVRRYEDDGKVLFDYLKARGLLADVE